MVVQHVESVARGGDDLHLQPCEIKAAAIGHHLFDAGNTRGTEYFRIGLGNKLLKPGGVVAMVMGDPDLGQFPAIGFERRQRRRRVSGVDQRRLAGFTVMKKDAVIVLIVGELIDGKRHAAPTTHRYSASKPRVLRRPLRRLPEAVRWKYCRVSGRRPCARRGAAC